MPLGRYIPPRPAGDSAEARFMQAVWDAIFGGTFPFVDQPDCLWNRTTSGYYPRIRPAARGKSSAPRPFHPFKVFRVPAADLEAAGYDPADSWRCFGVRWGYVGLRPKWEQIGESNTELVLRVEKGAQPMFEGAGFSEVDDFVTPSTSVLLFGTPLERVDVPTGASAGATGVAFFRFAADLDADGDWNAGLWIEITDEVEGEWPIVEIKGWRWGSGMASTQPLPNGPNIIGVGIILSRDVAVPPIDPQDLGIEQQLFDHVINRYPESPTVQGPAAHWRGDFQVDNLINQMFYPGDMITFTKNETALNPDGDVTWLLVRLFPGIENDTNLTSGQWQALGAWDNTWHPPGA
jgi:hypothetical protein